MDGRLASHRSERVARWKAGRVHDQPSRDLDPDDRRPRLTVRACRGKGSRTCTAPRPKRAVRSSLHPEVVARWTLRRLQLVEAGRISRRADGRHRRRIDRRVDPRPGHRWIPLVLSGRAISGLSLGPDGYLERLRLRTRDAAIAPGHQRRQWSLSTRALTRRTVTRIHRLHARRIRFLRHGPRRDEVARCVALGGLAPRAGL